MSESYDNLSDFANLITTVQDRTSHSLPSVTKSFMIESPLFIQESVMRNTEPIDDVINNLYEMYLAYILVAIKLQSHIGGGRVIRNILSTVGTGHTDVSQLGSESYYESEDIINGFATGILDNKKVNLTMSTETQTPKDTGANWSITSGRIVMVDVLVDSGDSKLNTLSVPIFLKLNPRIFPDSITDSILENNIRKDVRQRFFQYRAGEISFIKDFVFQLDVLSKNKKALKDDRSNVLYEILRKKNANRFGKLAKLANIIQSNNFHDSSFIFDKYSLESSAIKAGVKIDRYADRQKFFRSAMTSFLVGVDNRYSCIDMYTDSNKQVATYDFNQLKKNSKKTDIPITELMKAMSSGNLNSRTI